MIISHEHKFIFLKTRKTAGTSIEIALSRFCGERDVITTISAQDEALREELGHRGAQNFRAPLSEYTPEERARQEPFFVRTKSGKKVRVRYYNHMLAEQARAMIGTTVWDEYFKFCFERNPWDKAISLYFWRNKRGPRPSLLEFLRHENEKVLSKGKTTKLSNFGIYSIDGNLAMDHVGLYENLDSELERISELLSLSEKIRLPGAKGAVREDRRHYRDVMGQEERSIVAQLCAREIARFGYSF